MRYAISLAASAFYKVYKKLIDNKKIDAIIIGTPYPRQCPLFFSYSIGQLLVPYNDVSACVDFDNWLAKKF